MTNHRRVTRHQGDKRCWRRNAIAVRFKPFVPALAPAATLAALLCVATGAAAQQPNASRPERPICDHNLVISNVPRSFKNYLSNSDWLNMAGVFDQSSNEKVVNSRLVLVAGQQVVCRYNLSFDFVGANRDRRHVDIKDLDFSITTDKGEPTLMETYGWPTEQDHKRTENQFLAKWAINGVPLLPQVQAAVSASPKPANIMEAMSMMNGAARAQAEQSARQQGFSGMFDAEAARRAKLTPKERAAEDAYNAGPARGETICIVKDGIRRCKTGR